MYKDYTLAMENCINGKIDVKVWNMIVNSTRSDFSISINISKVSKKIGASRTTVHSLINRMVDNYVIKKTEDGYEFNPFIYCPYGASDDVVAKKQDEWKRRGNE